MGKTYEVKKNLVFLKIQKETNRHSNVWQEFFFLKPLKDIELQIQESTNLRKGKYEGWPI